MCGLNQLCLFLWDIEHFLQPGKLTVCHRLLLSGELYFWACKLKMDQPKRLNIDYSLKNIPIPSADSYKRRLIEKVESVIRRMRWKAFFFLKGSEEVEDEGQENNNYGLCKTKACPPQVEELKPFENDLLRMVEGISFRNMSDPFQAKMKADIKDIRNSKEVIVRADKTRNLYRVEQDHYSKLLRDNVTKHS